MLGPLGRLSETTFAHGVVIFAIIGVKVGSYIIGRYIESLSSNSGVSSISEPNPLPSRVGQCN